VERKCPGPEKGKHKKCENFFYIQAQRITKGEETSKTERAGGGRGNVITVELESGSRPEKDQKIQGRAGKGWVKERDIALRQGGRREG